MSGLGAGRGRLGPAETEKAVSELLTALAGLDPIGRDHENREGKRGGERKLRDHAAALAK